jgi:hypothetical protein
MSAASDAYATFLTKAGELETLRTQGLLLVDEMRTLELTIMREVGPKGRPPHPRSQGEVAAWGGRMMGMPHPANTFSLVALVRDAYSRLFPSQS